MTRMCARHVVAQTLRCTMTQVGSHKILTRTLSMLCARLEVLTMRRTSGRSMCRALLTRGARTLSRN